MDFTCVQSDHQHVWDSHVPYPATVAEGSEDSHIKIKPLGTKDEPEILVALAHEMDVMLAELRVSKIKFDGRLGDPKAVLKRGVMRLVSHRLERDYTPRSTAIPKEEVERAIGVDEDYYDDTGCVPVANENNNRRLRGRNKLRAEIRSKLGLGTTNNANTGEKE
jgi:hypothetical protein